MSSNEIERSSASAPSENGPSPSSTSSRSRWRTFWLLVKVIEVRLRFVAVMAATGLTFAYWDTLWNYYDKWMRPPTEKVATVSTTEYYCPMHPQVVRDEPGSCPICGMPLAKRRKGEKTRLPEGVLARVQLSPMRVRQAGVQTVEVVHGPLARTLTTTGFIEHDERRVAHIAAKVPGKSRVEKLYVNFEGTNVPTNQPLAELYSPELYQATRELLINQRNARGGGEGARLPLVRRALGAPEGLLKLSIEKLKLWGITQTQIDTMLKEGRADYRVPIYSPLGGAMVHVLQKNVVEGQYIEEGQPLFVVADLGRVWIRAKVYERDIPLIHVGQTVEATVESWPGEVFSGTVAFIFPHLDAATRTIDVRYDMDNPEHRLRPGMFATVRLKTPMADTPLFRAMGPRPALARVRRAAATGADAGGGGVVQRTSLTVEEQKVCPVTGAGLGSMGDPVPVQVKKWGLWACCDICPPRLKADPERYLAKLGLGGRAGALAPTVEEQKECPVTGAALGSMGKPVLVETGGRKVWTCCKMCPPKLKAHPEKYLARLDPPPAGGVLSVPEMAVIDTGTLKMVYVETSPGVYEGRKVVLGPRAGDRFPVLGGLLPGEKVVAAGAFLVDAESRLNPASRAEGRIRQNASGEGRTGPEGPVAREHVH